MSKKYCPYCAVQVGASEFWRQIKKSGHYRRKSDNRIVQIFRCLRCLKYFSTATLDLCYRQHKRHKNSELSVDFASSTSMRRCAKNHSLSRTTVLRKHAFLFRPAAKEARERNLSLPKAKEVQFDDLETFEHTKCKPLSVTLAVEKKTRRILGFEVSQMSAKGTLAKKARKKYGPRKDERARGRARLFKSIESLIDANALIESDQNPYYLRDVRRFFPHATYITHKGQRGSLSGQGELKKVRFDPLFSLNHTCAMLRDNIKRLGRKTWCTTKKPENLRAAIAIYVQFHNSSLIKQPTS
jgi:hypothetical protein